MGVDFEAARALKGVGPNTLGAIGLNGEELVASELGNEVVEAKQVAARIAALDVAGELVGTLHRVLVVEREVPLVVIPNRACPALASRREQPVSAGDHLPQRRPGLRGNVLKGERLEAGGDNRFDMDGPAACGSMINVTTSLG